MTIYLETTNNYIQELKQRKSDCGQEILDIIKTIYSLENLLETIDKQEDKNISTINSTYTEKRKGPKVKKITEAIVRSAVKKITIDSQREIGQGVDQGYFTAGELCNYIGVARSSSPVVSKILKKFENKQYIESKKYKNGFQYKLIPIENIKDNTSNVLQSSQITSQENVSDAIPGTGKSHIYARDKDIQEIIRNVQKLGYKVEKLGSGHTRVSNGKGRSAIIGTTGNKPYERKVIISRLNSIGIEVT